MGRPLTVFIAAVLSGRALAVPMVSLNQTLLIGRDIPALGQEFFGGIPFAEPPLGDLRLAPPVPKFSLDTATFDATSFGASCPQGRADESEDCLTINVLRPAGITENASLPVMAWVHGGGFLSGTASIYNASAIVAQSVIRGTPVIYVNFNYRLGPLGFPLGNEVVARGAQNLGLKDQLTALRWIQENIAAFGGDKTKVTVFGESAGAISLAILTLDPNFSSLARAAIFESGSASSLPVFPASAGETVWQSFVSAIPECAGTSSISNINDTIACIRAANLSSILIAESLVLDSAPSELPFAPTLDGPDGLLPDIPSKLWEAGRFAKIPFIAGTNLDEGTSFVSSSINSTAQVREWILAPFTASSNAPNSSLPGNPELETVVDTLLQLYPDVPALGSPFNTGNETFGLSSQYKRAAALAGDVVFQAPRRAWISAASSNGVKTFGYLFTDPQPQLDPALGVTHTMEVFYVYGAVTGNSSAVSLSRNMIDYWVSFATSLDPNDGCGNSSRPRWEAYTPRSQAILELNGAKTTMIPDTYRQRQIAFINSVPTELRAKRSMARRS